MKNLKVSMKLIVGFMIMVALAIVVGGIGIFGMYSINKAGGALYDENVIAVGAMGDIRANIAEQDRNLREYALYAGDSVRIQEIQRDIQVLEREMEESVLAYEGTIVDRAAETDYFNARDVYNKAYADLKISVREASLTSREDAVAVLNDPTVVQMAVLLDTAFTNSMNNNDMWAKQKADENNGIFMSMLTLEVVVLVIAVAGALILALSISGLISKPLVILSEFMNRAGGRGDISLSPEDMKNIGQYAQIKDEIGQTINGCAGFVQHVTTVAQELETIAGGDLSLEIVKLSEVDTMGNSLSAMVDKLNEMFSEIHSSTNQVSTGSRQVADGAQTLAQGSTEQAASIQELSSSISDIADRTKANAQNADRTSKLSGTIKENAEKGSRQMNDMIAAVEDINEASKNISKIIKTIDDIAFQTNILALNAAVEAARAGQHGKGFAVVAEEVRNLASKSAEAAKDTGDMIQNSMDKAELGSRIAGETSVSLSDIVSGINESAQLISDLAKSSDEQLQGILQINTGIDQVAQVVQQNSATAQESAAASQEMSSQSDMLEQLIAQFKLKHESQASVGRISATANKRAAAPKRLAMPEKATPVGIGGGTNYGKY